MSTFPRQSDPEFAEAAGRLHSPRTEHAGRAEPEADHRTGNGVAQDRLTVALSQLMHFASSSGGEFDAALQSAHASYIEARGGQPRRYPDAVTDGERYGWVAGVADYSTEEPSYQVQFLGDPAPVTAGSEMLRGIEPPDIALGSWRPSLPMAVYLLANHQVDRELLTERELGSPSLPQDRDRQRLLRGLTTWGRLDEDRLLAGLRPLMDKIRAGREAELDDAFGQISHLVATEFPARAPTTGAPAPAPGRRSHDHGDPRRPRPTP